MRRLKCLQKLHVTFSLCRKPSDEYLRDLSKSLKNLASLRSFTLHLSDTEVTNERLSNLGKSLERLPFLQSIGLIFSNCKGTITQGLSLICQSLKSSRSFEDLWINFSTCPDLTQEGIKRWSECFKDLSFLKYIDLKVMNCPTFTKDEYLETVSTGLEYLSSLKSVILYLGSYYCDDIVITDQGLRSLAKGLSRLKSLRKLELSFDECVEISNEGLESLSKGLKGLKTLSFLHLNFPNSIYITDEGTFGILEVLLGLPLLKSFCFHFPNCPRLGDQTLKKLIENLNSHASLQDLYINLDGCDISKEQLENFGECIETLSSLQNLRLELPTDKKIDIEDLKKVANECIKRHPELKIIINQGLILMNIE